MKSPKSINVHDGGRAPSPDDSQNRNRLWPVWAGVAASVGALSWLLGAPNVFHVIAAWPIALGVCVSILLLPVVLRGAVWIKLDAAAAAGRGGVSGGDVFLRR